MANHDIEPVQPGASWSGQLGARPDRDTMVVRNNEYAERSGPHLPGPPAAAGAGASRAGCGPATPKIGLVGLGRIGRPICANLVRAGYPVLAVDRRPEASGQAAGCGGRWVPDVARGVQVLEAPADGGVAAAREGAQQLLVGGEAEVVARHRDLLEVLARPGQVRHVGGYGAGYTAKLLIKLVWFGQRHRRQQCGKGQHGDHDDGHDPGCGS
jgi:NAD binding domain of 6-phosphogluconate dehydrogenase